MSGNATLMAAQEIRKTLLRKAGEMMKMDPEGLDLVDREVVDIERSGKSLPLAQVVRACASDGFPLYNVALFKAPFRNLTQYEKIEGQVFPDFTFGTHAAEVVNRRGDGKIRCLSSSRASMWAGRSIHQCGGSLKVGRFTDG
jgi:CO/xanthine dehydrogenase Mo-binding subunit